MNRTAPFFSIRFVGSGHRSCFGSSKFTATGAVGGGEQIVASAALKLKPRLFVRLDGLRGESVGHGVFEELLFVVAVAPAFSGVGALAAAFVHHQLAQAAQVFQNLEVIWRVSLGHGDSFCCVKASAPASRPAPSLRLSLRTMRPTMPLVAA